MKSRTENAEEFSLNHNSSHVANKFFFTAWSPMLLSHVVYLAQTPPSTTDTTVARSAGACP
jgi:hypothetical protein